MARTGDSEAITLLWQLKRACDASSDNDLPYIHFSALLGNQNYRDSTLTAASTSSDPAVSELAQRILTLAPTGSLLRQAGADAMKPGSFDQTTEFEASLHTARKRRVIRSALTGATVVAGLALFVFLLLSRLNNGPSVDEIAGNLESSTTWKAGKRVVLTGLVFVEPGVKLTIEPGVTVLGQPGSALLVANGAEFHARGRPDAPIVFTSAQPVGTRQAGDWGGLVLMGDAPTNIGIGRIEGVPDNEPLGAYGGQNPDGSCGVLEYVRVEFAGFEISANNELNGLTLAGCGAGTIVRHVQVHSPLDDGVEMFGGTANLRNLLITRPGDDAFDWDLGWTGSVQSLVVQMGRDVGDNAFEGDNNGPEPDAEPRSNPTFINVTLVADPNAPRAQRAMTLREGTAGTFRNLIIAGFKDEAISIRDRSQALASEGQLSISHALFIMDRSNRRIDREDPEGFDIAAWLDQPELQNQTVVNPAYLSTALDPIAPYFAPDIGPALAAVASIPQGEFWNRGARHRGGVRPGSADNWLSGWTAFPPN